MTQKSKLTIIELPSAAQIYSLAQESLQSLPPSISEQLANFTIEVKNFADKLTLKELSMTNSYAILGLYRGIPVPLKKKKDYSKSKDTIHLYRCPLIFHSLKSGKSVKSLVSHVIINELARHFDCTPYEMACMHQSSKVAKH